MNKDGFQLDAEKMFRQEPSLAADYNTAADLAAEMRLEYEEEGARIDAAEAAYNARVLKAAEVLNREFPDVPVYKQVAALKSDNVQFTSQLRKERYEAACRWINK